MLALAVYRTTRLVVADELTHPGRVWVNRRSKTLGYLVTCPWCMSIWVAAAFAVAWRYAPALTAWVGVVLAWSAVSGLLSEKVG